MFLKTPTFHPLPRASALIQPHTVTAPHVHLLMLLCKPSHILGLFQPDLLGSPVALTLMAVAGSCPGNPLPLL